MTDHYDERKVRLALAAIRHLTARELIELNRRLNDDELGGLGVREPRRPQPPTLPLAVDGEDRSVRGRTIR